ncbi:MAG TPA: GDYXXLXY domain-containing protein [Symbiobacteriaceae bacterium]|jgi:uncharacterized membrane-anchored protein
MSAKKFWLAVAVQILILFGLIGVHSYTLVTGSPVLLKTAPVDPWDPFRGDYVSLNYDISRLHPDALPMTGLPYQSGQEVWVTLKAGNPYWTAAAVSDRRPAVTGGGIALKGTVQWYSEQYTAPPGGPSPVRPAELMIRYGIEQFYVPEGEGQKIQDQRPDISVEAMVDRFGRAALHKVFISGKEIQWH